MRNKILAAISLVFICGLLIFTTTGCAAWNRACVDLKSDFGNGLDRVIRVYTANGELLAQYEGKIDLASDDGGYVKFDYNGKRYIYYNCFVESIAEID